MGIQISTFPWVPPFAQGYVKDIRPRWALAEAGLDYDVVTVSDGDDADYRRWQPFGQVPAYRDDTVELFESGATKGEDIGDEPIGLLATRAALVINTGNTPLARELDHFGDPLDRIWRQCLLSYCGVRTVDRVLYGVVAGSSAGGREAWLADVRLRAGRLGRVPADKEGKL